MSGFETPAVSRPSASNKFALFLAAHLFSLLCVSAKGEKTKYRTYSVNTHFGDTSHGNEISASHLAGCHPTSQAFGRNHAFGRNRAKTFEDQMSNPLAVTHAASADQIDSQVKTWLEAGIPLVIPGDQFRALLPMGTTFFYAEINSGRLRAVKHAGKACIPIEEAARYRSSLLGLSHSEAA